MYKEMVVKILSNYRRDNFPEYPRALTFRSILSLVEHCLSPNHIVNADQIKECLRELQAEGEVTAGTRNKFCIAPPTILVEDESNLAKVIFVGDRAYLELAHKALQTGQSIDRTQLHSRIYDFQKIKECLKNYGIRLLKTIESLDHLPEPKKLESYLLANAQWHDSLFERSGLVRQYVPKEWKTQRERWQTIERADQRLSQLLQLSTGEYLWFEEDQFYELSPDVASLAMFWLDKQAKLPLKVAWDEADGRLKLQETFLPSSYAQLLWRLSKPDPNQPRTRLFELKQRVLVRQAITKLGCQLV